jgi:hypothetical protein
LLCCIFARSEHFDDLQHRFEFLCWNIGILNRNTSKMLCFAATVSQFV